MNPPQRVDILGVQISAIHMQQALENLRSWIDGREPNYVCVTPAHGVMEVYRQPELLTIFNQSGMTTPDGMSIVWLLKLRGYPQVDRVYGPDLMLAACEHGLQYGWRHFLYGGAPGVAEDLANQLQTRLPGLQIAGTYTPPFRPLTPDEESEILEQINASGADIVWVGISTPKQERWMAAHIGLVDAPVMVGVGAAFDFISGRKPQAPRWIQRSGLEWLFRLLSEPRRLWRRYAQYPLFTLLVAAQQLGLKHFPEKN